MIISCAERSSQIKFLGNRAKPHTNGANGTLANLDFTNLKYSGASSSGLPQTKGATDPIDFGRFFEKNELFANELKFIEKLIKAKC
jgi:hypothetical protein